MKSENHTADGTPTMGEGSSAAWVNSPKRVGGGSDKIRHTKLAILPPQAEKELWHAADRLGQRALILLLTKYYLRPEQITSAIVEDCSLIVNGFERGIAVDPTDVDLVRAWLERKRRPRSAPAIRNLLASLKRQVAENLAASNKELGAYTDWLHLLDIGVVTIRRLARERHAEASNFEEATYCELLHDEDADPFDNLRWQSEVARRTLARAAQEIVSEIKEDRKTWEKQ